MLRVWDGNLGITGSSAERMQRGQQGKFFQEARVDVLVRYMRCSLWAPQRLGETVIYGVHSQWSSVVPRRAKFAKIKNENKTSLSLYINTETHTIQKQLSGIIKF